ncbi:ACP S-malonyltransferase [Chloroflexota bacterium]
MNKIAWIFPGQGAQFVRMGKDIFDIFPESRVIFETADEVLGYKLSELCFKGPMKTLTKTINAQPATFTMSIACLKAFESKIDREPSFFAGHSLGEYTALVAAKVFSFIDALNLVKERGRLMQQAPQSSKEGMAAIIGLNSKAVEEICAQVRAQWPGSYVQIANYNSPTQIVISGSLDAVKLCIKLAEEQGSYWATLLNVSRAFHSIFMQPVRKELEKVLSEVRFNDAKIPVISNVTGKALTTASEIKAELTNQLASPVQWSSTVENMINAGVTSVIEFGPGKILTGLIRSINCNIPLRLINLGDAKAIMSFPSCNC